MQTLKDKLNNLSWNNNIIISISVILGFIILGYSFNRGLSNISVLTNAQGITVSGISQREVVSDKGKITFLLSIDNSIITSDASVKKIVDARDSLIKYLTNIEKVKPEDISALSINTISSCTERDRNYYDNCIGKKYNVYNLSVAVASQDVNLIKDLSLNINTKIQNNLKTYFDGVNINTNQTEYYYGKFDAIKSEMLNEATKNAFERADAIANSTGNKAGEVITANQGVFQVTSKDSTDTSDYGYYDTSTIDKKITAVVRVSFKVK